MDTVRLKDILKLPLRSGFTVAAASRGVGIRMVNMGELFRHPRIPDVEMSRVTLPLEDENRTLLRADDLLFARRSLTLEGAGKCSIVHEAFEPTTWESSIIRARVDELRASPRYLFYYFASPQGRRQMETIVEQVAAAGIRLSELAKLLVPSPPLPEQQAIAEVLGALDDKIAANANVAATSNSLASTLFFRVSSGLEYGSATFQELSMISGGGTPSTKVPEYWDGEVNWATPTDLTSLPGPYLESTSRRITPAGFAACSSKLFAPGAILMTSRATIGAIAVAHVATAVNQGFIVVEPHDPLMRYWLQHEMSSRVAEFESWANGATFLELSRGTFKKLKVRVPDRQVLANFNDQASALHAASRAALLENLTLAATRDALLPQLMSGRLRVRNAESLVADVV